ncbi:MAG: hypothetical protein KatS3mg082_3174 [Nitrospiraceae bacterium]|nr:MAG: hypothetical protein KatS3mg082_3174 [Nitrospiraceae bacterium]
MEGPILPPVSTRRWSITRHSRRCSRSWARRSIDTHAPFTYAGGLVRCGHCGNLITAEQVTKKSGKQYVYYRCAVSDAAIIRVTV